ncbi:MAG: ABC transporter ATP-binding protein [Desulfosalsimonadaceae bacterium]|nr:ABC transporter ATP-binding protein [Desulfosalsimonadaceae bacterium]
MIRIHHLGKCYQIYEKPADRLKQYFGGWRKQYFNPFWALRDISINVEKGECVGIIGSNGSGKSTLLQLVCGTLRPSEGSIQVDGRIASLLELGSGFNPDFTGKENIYLSAALMGLGRHEIENKYQDIVSFADIGDFVDRPVKTYSTGMLIRLAFAVQTAVEPDILVIDEALSVGDIFFQQKCMGRMRNLQQSGVTLLFVSHDMSTVRDLCNRAAYIKQGRLIYFGATEKAIQLYYQEKSGFRPEKKTECTMGSPGMDTSVFLDRFSENAVWKNDNHLMNHADKGKLLAIRVVDDGGKPAMKVRMGNRLVFEALYQINTTDPLHIALVIKNKYDQVIFSGGTYTLNVDVSNGKSGDVKIFRLEADCFIESGAYTFLVNISETGDLPNRGRNIDSTPWLGPLAVAWDYENERAPFMGMFGLPCVGSLIDVGCDG